MRIVLVAALTGAMSTIRKPISNLLGTCPSRTRSNIWLIFKKKKKKRKSKLSEDGGWEMGDGGWGMMDDG